MRFIQCSILSLITTTTLLAQVPTVQQRTGDSSPPAATGVVLLSNGQVLDGSVRQEGSRVVVEQADGAKLRIATERVLCWGPNVQALHKYRIDHRGRPNIRDHLTEARWCITHELYREAALELLSVQKLSPHNSEASRLQSRLEEAMAPVRQVAATEDDMAVKAEPESKFVSMYATQRFTRSIQPVLLNRCGACHDSAKPTEFKLLRLTGTSRVSAEMTHTNMQRVLRWVDTENPMESPLLQFAQNPHGGAKLSPLGKTHVKALASLVDWVLLLSNQRGVTRIAKVPTSVTTSPFEESRGNDQRSSAALDEGSQGLLKRVEPAVKVEAPKSSQSKLDDSVPRRLPSIDDPFDPEVFNRRHHSAVDE